MYLHACFVPHISLMGNAVNVINGWQVVIACFIVILTLWCHMKVPVLVNTCYIWCMSVPNMTCWRFQQSFCFKLHIAKLQPHFSGPIVWKKLARKNLKNSILHLEVFRPRQHSQTCKTINNIIWSCLSVTLCRISNVNIASIKWNHVSLSQVNAINYYADNCLPEGNGRRHLYIDRYSSMWI